MLLRRCAPRRVRALMEVAWPWLAGEQRHIGVHPSSHRLLLIVAYGSHVAVAGLHARRDAGTRLHALGLVLFALPALHAVVPSEDGE
jgi:hypothetical protein